MNLDRATFLALAALLEIADKCGEVQIERTVMLRAILAFVALRTGKPDLSRYFWEVATQKHLHPNADGAYMNRYVRGTNARSIVNGMLDLCGWEPSVPTLRRLRELGRGKDKG